MLPAQQQIRWVLWALLVAPLMRVPPSCTLPHGPPLPLQVLHCRTPHKCAICKRYYMDSSLGVDMADADHTCCCAPAGSQQQTPRRWPAALGRRPSSKWWKGASRQMGCPLWSRMQEASSPCTRWAFRHRCCCRRLTIRQVQVPLIKNIAHSALGEQAAIHTWMHPHQLQVWLFTLCVFVTAIDVSCLMNTLMGPLLAGKC
jgi:hypothetical protein